MKGYDCLHLILNDLKVLLKMWKQRMQNQICKDYEAACKEQEGGILVKDFVWHSEVTGKESRRMTCILKSSKSFQRVFGCDQKFDDLISMISDIKGHIARLRVSCWNNIISNNKHCLPLEV